MSNSKRWLITGVSSGIGEALAKAVINRGDTVIGCARNAADVAKFEAIAPGRTNDIQVDVTRPEDIKRAVALAVAEGPLDVVVNNAGQSVFGALEEVSLEEMKSIFDVNVFGPWVLAQAVLPHFRERGRGQLVHMSSGCGLIGMPGLSAYCASKHALEGFSEALAAEVAQFGIKLLLVEPGAVATKFISHGTREAAHKNPAYEWLSGNGKAGLEGFYANYATPPEKVAEAVLAALDKPEQPLRILVGDDLRDTVRQKADQINKLATQ